MNTGRLKAKAGGMPSEPPWGRQNGQCSTPRVEFFSWKGEPAVPSSLTSFMPWTEQISVQIELALLADASAWDMDGASAANRIAIPVIHAANRLVCQEEIMARF